MTTYHWKRQNQMGSLTEKEFCKLAKPYLSLLTPGFSDWVTFAESDGGHGTTSDWKKMSNAKKDSLVAEFFFLWLRPGDPATLPEKKVLAILK